MTLQNKCREIRDSNTSKTIVVKYITPKATAFTENENYC